MNSKDFFYAVKVMREMQKLYFYPRPKVVRDVEEVVDNEIKRVEKIIKEKNEQSTKS